MTDTFLLFPNNEAFIRGAKRSSVDDQGGIRGVITLLVIIVFIGLSLFLGYQSLTILYDTQLLAQNSAQIVGQITERYTSDDDSVTYHLVYQFTTPDRAYSGDQQVSREFYGTYAVGQSIDVTYAPNDPVASRLTHFDSSSNDAFMVISTGVYIVIVAIVVTSSIVHTQRRSQLKREGKIITGELVSISGELDDDDYRVEVVVRFRSPSTLQLTSGKRRYVCNHLKRTRLPRPIVPVMIHYADEKVWEVL